MRHLKYYLLISIFVFNITGGYGQQEKLPLNRHLRIGYSTDLFSYVNKNDVKIAIDLLASEFVKTISQEDSSKYSVSTHFVNPEKDVLAQALHKKIDMITLSALEYLKSGNKEKWEPVLCAAKSTDFLEKFLLISRRKSGITQISQLEHKQMVYMPDIQKKVIELWLNQLVPKSFNTSSEHFFSKIKEVNKDSKALLQVYFGQSDVCVVSYPTYLTMLELNPNLKDDLTILVKSPPYLAGIACIRKDMDPGQKKMIVKISLKLPETKRGRQILKLFNENKTIPFEERYLQPLQDLLDRAKVSRGNTQ